MCAIFVKVQNRNALLLRLLPNPVEEAKAPILHEGWVS